MVSAWEKFNTNRRNAAEGQPDAQFYLGYCFLTGHHVVADKVKAEKWLRAAAAQGQRDAVRELSKMGYSESDLTKLREDRKIRDRLVEVAPAQPVETSAELTREERLRLAAEYSTGTDKNFSEAIKLLQPLVAQGDTVAADMFERILRLQNGGTDEHRQQAMQTYSSLREVRERAANGDANAQFRLAESYYYGRNVDQDYDLALKWYRNAAESGNAEAACQVGNCYIMGNGAPVNQDKAFGWFRSAADGGSVTGLYNLGLCYRNGWGVAPDRIKEMECYRKAAEAGNARAQYELGKAYYLGYEKVDLMAAHFWLARACNQDVPEALVLLARLYEEGIGVNRDEGFAYNLLQKVVRMGGHEADALLAKYYYHGDYVTQDYDKAAELARESAEAGDTVNQLLMSRYYSARGDFCEAFRWLKKSSSDGDGDTMYELGIYYRDGKGTAPDTEAAYKCFRAAVDAGCDKAIIPLANCYKHGLGVAKDNNEAVRLAKLYKARVSREKHR